MCCSHTCISDSDMANVDVLDILSDTLTPVNRTSTNKDEIIRDKVLSSIVHLFVGRIVQCAFCSEERPEESRSSARRHET
jgi:hypothetical protein